MSNPIFTTPEGKDDYSALVRLVVDNPALEELETRLGGFNVFEALGMVRHELRHSDFLAFLLNPGQNHGMGDEFVRRLLQKVLISANGQSLPISPIDLDVWDLNGIVVLREWLNIDILLVDESHQLIVIVENKIDSGERSGQLDRYHEAIQQRYPGWRIIGIYLTPEGIRPTNNAYLIADYITVCNVIERLIEYRSTTLGADIRTLLIHYTQMLRRHIVSESEIQKLCLDIYRKHQRALDLIFEFRPDQQAVVREMLEGLVKQEVSSFVSDYSSKGSVRFLPTEWDAQALKGGHGWTASGRILLFEFTNSIDRVRLNLYIGPGPEEVRRRLFQMALDRQPPFRTSSKSLNLKWNVIYGRSFLISKDYQEFDGEEIQKKLEKQWSEFLRTDFPILKEALADELRIW